VHRSSEGNFAGLLVRRLSEASCLIDAARDEIISGAELPRRILNFAAGFISAGLRPGDRLLVACELSPASTLAYLGAMYAGVVPVLIEERMLGSSGEVLFAKSQAKAFWTAEGVGCEWAAKAGVKHFEGSFEPRAEGMSPCECAADDLAVLVPTSGSTGVPRLVMVSHGNLRANTEAIVASQNLRSQGLRSHDAVRDVRGAGPGASGMAERAMLIMPISYCFGASVVHTHLYQGGGVVFDSRFMFPDKVLHAINTHACTMFAGVPIIYNVLLRRSNLRTIPLPRLRRFLQAGGALAPESVKEMTQIAPTAEFFVMYGQTEATARISCLPASRLKDKLGSVGVPLDNVEVRIVARDELRNDMRDNSSENGREAAVGETGEIQVRGPSVCLGYLNDPEATARKFSNGWLKTGDFARRDEDGFLWIQGRTDDFLKIRGVRVSVGEVEEKVAAMAGVSECAAVGVKHPEAGEALALLVVAENGHAANLGEAVRRALPTHWTCVSVKIVTALPRTANGKIARAELAALL
jgi:acyl-CoA synthetase (AMP-forming)/AMP-acid ligase II